MKTVFKKSETRFGCYGNNHILVRNHKGDTFTIQDVLSLNIPLKDKFWFVRNNCDLTGNEFRKLAIGVATVVLPIYELKYPDNKAPRGSIQAAQDYLNGIGYLDVLYLKRKDAVAAAAYAHAADDDDAAYAASAALSAADAAYADAYASADAATDAAYDAADAAYADAYADFRQKLLDFLTNFTNEKID